MNWKTYKDLPPTQKYDEAYYIIGLDIGNESTGIAFYNLYENRPEAIDLSGGYGKPSIPTLMQYIPETKEWVFGEYAILNQSLETAITFSNFLSRLGHHDYLEIENKTIRFTTILALYIKEILGNVRNINPKAEIVGIVAAIPDKLSNDAELELRQAFQLAGYEKELITLTPGRECVLAHYFRNHTPKNEKILLLDYGNKSVRCGVYEAREDGITALSNVFDENIGTGPLMEDVIAFFSSIYEGETTPGFNEQLAAFAYQHKDLLFQKNIRTKPLKLYYNFVYPPFQQTINYTRIQQLIDPYTQGLNRLILDALKKNIAGKKISPRDIDALICVGGGFEMLWAKDTVNEIFDFNQIHMCKNPKLVTAEGAAWLAAFRLGITNGQTHYIKDSHQLLGDIGIGSGDAFLPLAYENSYWWQKHEPKLILVKDKINGELGLSITERTSGNNERILASPTLTGLPIRPKGTTRLKFGVDFLTNTSIKLKISDQGFGELFPKSNYQQELVINL